MRRVACLLFVILISCVCAQTPNHFKEIFIGRCALAKQKVDCEDLWHKFSEVWVGKDPLSVKPSDYEVLLEDTNFNTPPNRAIFWSGASQFITSFSSNNNSFIAVEETLLGSILNKLEWCESTDPDSPIELEKKCPIGNLTDEKGNLDAHGSITAFWAFASREFAKHATGKITILLRAQNGNLSYRPDGFLRHYEIPFMKKEEITGVDLLVIPNLSLVPPERCGSGSLVNIARDLKDFPNVNCIDDSERVREIICKSDPQSPACSFMNQYTKEDVIVSIVMIVLVFLGGFVSAIILTLVVILVVFIIVQAKKKPIPSPMHSDHEPRPYY